MCFFRFLNSFVLVCWHILKTVKTSEFTVKTHSQLAHERRQIELNPADGGAGGLGVEEKSLGGECFFLFSRYPSKSCTPVAELFVELIPGIKTQTKPKHKRLANDFWLANCELQTS